MKRTLIGATCLGLLTACPKAPMQPESTASLDAPSVSTPGAPPRISGVEAISIDPSIRPQDDFYKYVNNRWLQENPMPADKARLGSFDKLSEESLSALRGIIEACAKDSKRAPGSETQQIGDLYASFMDEARLQQLGLAPMREMFLHVDAIKDKADVVALIAEFRRVGLEAPFVSIIAQDDRDSTRYVMNLHQSGLGLPDRDYYLKADDAKLHDALTKYQAHIVKMLTLAGDQDPAGEAAAIVALETQMAQAQWTKVQNRDAVKTYNKVDLKSLDALAPGLDWKRFFTAAEADGKVADVIVNQPSYVTSLAKILQDTPLATWKSYFRWHALDGFAPYLSKAFVEENFAFNGTVLSGVTENRPRWKRAVNLVEHAVGEGLGKLYVAQYFPPESKARMEELVGNLMKAYAQSIDTLQWMTPATKKEAQAKLAVFTPKIGYPKTWRDYSALVIAADDLVGNVQRARIFEYRRNVNKLGKPVDRDEWHMTPQTINAYYNPNMNEIVFPAAILQPPFFNAVADDAVNYGGIGAVIGHEVSHGFDDQGSQYDGVGNLRDWWTADDHKAFAAKTQALVAQYSAQEPLPGYHVNGELTLGENIADNSGLAIAYKAYHLSLHGKPAPVIDGLTGDQRFFIGWAQVWRGKSRENEAIKRIKTDPHSPAEIRGGLTVENQPGFFEAFGIKPGDKLWVAPENRIIIW